MFPPGLLLKELVKTGKLVVIDARGGHHEYGGPGEDNPHPVTMRLHDPALHWKLCVNPHLHFGEAYMNGSLTVENGDIYDVLELILANVGWQWGHPLLAFVAGLRRLGRRISQYNPIPRAQRNVAHHYDLSGQLYDLFLDKDRQYSCAYYITGRESLDEAQENKKRHIAAKLRLEPGQRILDIGSGWGGLALHLAGTADVEVVGITLSEEQYRLSRERAEKAGLAERVEFRLQDYRDVDGSFDRIVSVGMFEHVGVNHYAQYFNKVSSLLTPDGIALLHSIGRADGPGATNPWIRKYIFPGGYVPALSEVVPVIENAGFYITDVEILRLHYAETLREWRRRTMANREQIKALYDDRFVRMWEFYLAGSEATFRYGGHMVFQMQMAKDIEAVPWTRDYITDAERQRGRPARAA